MGVTPGWRTKIPHASYGGENKKPTEQKPNKPIKQLPSESMKSCSIEDGTSLREGRYLKKRYRNVQHPRTYNLQCLAPNQKLHGMQTGRKTMRSDNEEKRKLSETDPQLTQPSKDIDDLNNTID